MNHRAAPPRLATWLLTSASVLALASPALATPGRGLAPTPAPTRVARVPARAPRAPARRAPPPPPPPPVTLQLAGLRVPNELSHAGVMHAIARDAWPALARCVSPPPRVRGYASVSILLGAARPEVQLGGAPLAGDGLLPRCVRRAVSAIVLPPHDDVAETAAVSFDLLFNLPAIQQRPARAPQPERAARR